MCFATGDPSGLAASLPGALAQLRQVIGGDAPVLFGFDRGGSYPVAFRAIRAQHADWVTWRRGALAPVTAAASRSWVARGDGKPAGVLSLADETVTIKDYGQCRQITLFEDGAPVMQVLTSDTTAPAGAVVAWLRCRWRIENLFKYLEDNYGIHWMSDYHASLEDDDHLTANPERTAARARLRGAGQDLAAAERELAGILSAPDLTAAAKNTAIPAAEKKITQARDAVTAARAALKGVPAKLPASQVTPGAQKAILRTRRRSLQMVSCGCSPQPPDTGWPPASTTTCATTTNTAPSPETCSTSAARSPTTRRRSPSPSAPPPRRGWPAPSPCSSTRSTPPRPACPATSGPSPTSSRRLAGRSRPPGPAVGFSAARRDLGGLNRACADV